MSYLGQNTPPVVPDIDDAPFWAAAADKTLVLQCCADCGTFRHPPSPICPSCQSMTAEWHRAPDEGELFSFTITHVAAPGVDRGSVPFNVALVAFPGRNDVRMITNIVDAAPEDLAIGAKVKLAWECDGAGQHLPRFRLK